MPDWDAIRNEYITTDISYRALAKKHGASFSTLRARAKKEHWPELRGRFCADLSADTIRSVKKARVEDGTGILLKLQRSADNMVFVVDAILSDTDRIRRSVVRTLEGDGEKVDLIDTKTIRGLTAALKDLTGVIRDVYELPGAAERSAMEIAAERLKLEQVKVNSDDGDGRETGVVVLPAVIAEADVKNGEGE